MKLIERFKQGKCVVTCEVGPPKGIEITGLIDELEPLRDKVDAFNVTDLQSSVLRVGSLATCRLLKDKDLEPIMQLTCRDRNRLGLQSDVLSGAVLGIENLLCLTGDHPKLGDHPDAMPVFDLDSVQLLSAVKGLMDGKDMAGNDLEGRPPDFESRCRSVRTTDYEDGKEDCCRRGVLPDPGSL
jgi:5,10-methylenetetrahydrofolate reductase